MRDSIVEHLRLLIPKIYWLKFWYSLPIISISLLPLGAGFLQILIRLGLNEGPRLTQLLILFSICFGLIVGCTTFFLVGRADLGPTETKLIKLLSVIAFVFPLSFFFVITKIIEMLTL